MEWEEQREVMASAFAEMAETCRVAESANAFAPHMVTVMFTALKMIGQGDVLELVTIPFGGLEAVQDMAKKLGELG